MHFNSDVHFSCVQVSVVMLVINKLNEIVKSVSEVFLTFSANLQNFLSILIRGGGGALFISRWSNKIFLDSSEGA